LPSTAEPSPILQSTNGYQPFAEDRSAAARKPGLDHHAAAGKGGVNQSVGFAGEGHMSDGSAGFTSEEQKITGLNCVQGSGSPMGDLLS